MPENLKLIKLNKNNYLDYEECIQNFRTERFPAGESFLKCETEAYIERDSDYAIYLVLVTCDGNEFDIIAYFALRASSIFFSPDNSYPIVNPSIEISYFSINDNYTSDEDGEIIGIGLGTLIFFDKILPLIREIKEKLGINYISLFSLPIPKVLNAYSGMGFNKASDDIEAYIRYYDVKDCKLMFYNLNKD